MVNKIFFALIIIVVLLGGSVLYLNYRDGGYGQLSPISSDLFNVTYTGNDENMDDASDRNNPENFLIKQDFQLKTDNKDYSSYYKNAIKEEGVEWLNQPVFFGALDLIQGFGEYKTTSANFYQIGKKDGNPIIATIMQFDGPGQYFLAFLKKDNKYFLISDKTDDQNYYNVREDVVISNDITFKIFPIPSEINILGKKFISSGAWTDPNFFSEAVNLTSSDLSSGNFSRFETLTDYGPLFSTGHIKKFNVDSKDGPNNLVYEVLRFENGLSNHYTQQFSFIGDDGVPNIKWNDGSKNTLSYKASSVGGCGSFGGVEVVSDPALVEGDIYIGGYTNTNEPIYLLNNINNPVVTDYYSMTNGEYYDYSGGEGKVAHFTKDDILNQKLVFLYKDAFGRYVVFSSTIYGPAVECGKPVIYLYPEETQSVSVKVGADVTKSDPEYGDGWQVIANPDGQLEWNGQSYDYLFWEGLGYGEYPVITSGTVVKIEEAPELISKQLAQLGLNQKEISDFKDFWISHLPKRPYVRISWILTEEMNALAPLSIKPNPDTLIRVFMDFEGMDDYKEIPPQKLSSIQRNGFTVVEWGGLLSK